ncbi:nuclear factor NF2 [Cardiosporidium cionae]|uniref:Nuclear factor NF2 n=1 Tax=Cardiosporidium cionae TaxID=476202 RepID=A0ABQ7JEB4_9APIC|nr:nuclear factor NF2 [Cardiosporidium cionae]|eukprot:KAF8822353.1 nuclear factor NF2 [Cardiosporidium cionae]
MSGTTTELELHEEIRRLVNERNLIDYRLKSARGGRLGWGMRGGGSNRSTFRVESRPTNFHIPYPTTLSSFPPDATISVKRQREEPTPIAFEGPEFEVEKRPKIIIDEKTEERNRRLLNFGVLGHLNRARDQLQKEENSKQAQLQKSKVQRVAEKLQHGKKNLVELRRMDFELKRNEDVKKYENVEQQLIEKENELLRMNLAKHYQNMKNFISTKTFPTLFWLPAIMDEKTEQLKMDTVKIIEEKIETLRTIDFSAPPLIASASAAEPLPMTDEHISEMRTEGESAILSVGSSETLLPEAVDDTILFSADTSVDVTAELHYGVGSNNVHTESDETNFRSTIGKTDSISQNEKVTETPVTESTNLLIPSEAPVSSEIASREENHAASPRADRNGEVPNSVPISPKIKTKVDDAGLAEAIVPRRNNDRNPLPEKQDQAESMEASMKDTAHAPAETKENSDLVVISKLEMAKKATVQLFQDAPMLTREEVEEMTVASLVHKLKENGLNTQGKKAVLKERLLQYLEA